MSMTGTHREIEQLETRLLAAFDAQIEAFERRLSARIDEARSQTILIMIGVILTTAIAVFGVASAAAGLT